LPGTPVTEKNELMTFVGNSPPGFAELWFDIKPTTKLCAAGAMTPENGPEK
jgi:hypothetical protein